MRSSRVSAGDVECVSRSVALCNGEGESHYTCQPRTAHQTLRQTSTNKTRL